MSRSTNSSTASHCSSLATLSLQVRSGDTSRCEAECVPWIGVYELCCLPDLLEVITLLLTQLVVREELGQDRSDTPDDIRFRVLERPGERRIPAEAISSALS